MNLEPFLLRAIPALDGAACRGRAPAFDDGADEAAALAVCGHCGALQSCRAWFDTLAPRDRPDGVVAGIVHHRGPSGPTTKETKP